MNWNAIVIIVCALLAAFMLWQELRRENRLRLPLRLLAVVLAVIALACIALPITYNSKSITGIKDGVLLTPGFNADSLASYQTNKLFATEASITKADPKLKISLIDLADVPQGKLNIARLHVLGYGLNGDELKQLSHTPIKFHSAKPKAGIVAINWNHHIKTGEKLTMQGKFAGAPAKTRLVLKGLNTGLDSIIIPVNGSFSLQTIPKSVGRSTYDLIAINGADTLEHETIPFEVEPAKPLKVLMLATSPDFESRFLKNWLAQHNYGVTVRTAISKEKFSREYFNMPQTDVDHISATLLDKFDVLVGDLSAFKLLSPAESGAIQQQMVQKSLGVIVKADSINKGQSFLANVFALDRLSDKNQRTLSLNIEGQTSPSGKLTLDAIFIKPQQNTQPLVTDEQGRIIVSSTIYGSGKIVFSTLSNSFNWALAGDQNDYTALWSTLITKASRKATLTQKWRTSPAFPIVDEPATIINDGPTSLPEKVKIENTPVAFAQNPVLPFSWSAAYWPSTYGWQQVTQNNTPVYWWYAYQPDEWKTLRAAEKTDATVRYVAQNPAKASISDTTENIIKVPVSKLYFYLLLLLCFTYLWVERKL